MTPSLSQILRLVRRLFESQNTSRENGKRTGLSFGCNRARKARHSPFLHGVQLWFLRVHEVKRHCSSQKHEAGLRVVSQQQPLTALLHQVSSKSSFQDQVTTAELLFTTFLVEHNLPLSSADHFMISKLSKMFPDSKIAESYVCGWTKTTAIVNHTLAPGNYLVCFLHGNVDGRRKWGTKENQVKLRKISKITKENTRKGLASMKLTKESKN